MLFNSYQFILAFLPVTVLAFYLFGKVSTTAALRWLTLASLVFYAWWRPVNVAIILPSILINFLLARRLQTLARSDDRPLASRLTLIAGITFNVLFLGYFKYSNFMLGTVNDAFGTNFVLTKVILPLGISFITFQKIAFLIDVQARRVEKFTFSEYALFVLFFPQLIAGPIVHYREMMPQFANARCRFNLPDVSVGLTMFFLGLFKKVFLADGIAPLVTPIFERASAGDAVSLLPAAMAAVGFTLQIYFDFSGYSDMAIGLGRFFGVRLPANFDSPLRAASIIDYWQRWHITLSRFLTAYLYNPMLLALTRRRARRGGAAMVKPGSSPGAFLTLIVFPTLVTMFISGVWHGAGYTFIIWGLLHGVYLSLNHGWRLVKARFPSRWWRPVSAWGFPAWLLTFVCIVLAMVFFRAPNIAGAWSLLCSLVGAHGIGLPDAIFNHLGPLAELLRKTGGGPETWWGAGHFLLLAGWTIALLLIALLLPNTLQLLNQYEPALTAARTAAINPGWFAQLRWRPNLSWALVIAALAAAGILRFSGPSEFLYWQF